MVFSFFINTILKQKRIPAIAKLFLATNLQNIFNLLRTALFHKIINYLNTKKFCALSQV